MEVYKKSFIIKNKKTDEFYSVYVKLELKKVEGKRFDTFAKGEFIAISITGNLYYHERKGVKGFGSSGQINGELEELNSNWQIPHKLRRLLQIWKEWHLNDLMAGTKSQVEALKKCRFSGYDEQVEFLKSIGLYCDRDYKYGTDWLIKPVPDKIIVELKQIFNK